MAMFIYTAKERDGSVKKGRMEADSTDALKTIIHDKGLLVMDIRKASGLDLQLNIGRSKIEVKELALFCRQFHTMLNAGINILECLDVLKDQVSDERFKSAIVKLNESIQLGSMLSAAMRQHPAIFPQILSSMAEVGEMSGTLADSMGRIADYFDKEHKVSQRVRSAMTYPVVILVIVVLVVAFLLIFIVPKFMSMFLNQGIDLPIPTKVLIAISGKNALIPLAIISGLVLLVTILKKTAVTEKGKKAVDNLTLKLPVIGNYNRKLVSYKLTKTLSELLYAGVPLISALRMCAKVLGNSVYSAKVDQVIENVNLGFQLAAAFEDISVFPSMVIKMIRIGEEAGTLDEMTAKVAEFYESELDASITKMITMVEPVMILTLAIIVGFIVIAMIMPLFSSYQVIGG